MNVPSEYINSPVMQRSTDIVLGLHFSPAATCVRGISTTADRNKDNLSPTGLSEAAWEEGIQVA